MLFLTQFYDKVYNTIILFAIALRYGNVCFTFNNWCTL